MKSDITIIILLYNCPIKFLNNLKVFKKFNLIILDQSNDKIFKKKLSEMLPNIKSYTLRKKNYGYAKGINDLVKKVKTKYFFQTQPDISIDKKSILNLRKTIIKYEKKAAIVVPAINNFLNFNKNKKQKKEIIVENIVGIPSFFADKKKFIDLGMFDEDFFFYWEDVELANRIKKSQYKIFLNRAAKAIHNTSNSSIINFKTSFIKNSNFIYGEFLYDYKVKNLRFLKLFRKLFQNVIFSFFNILIFRLEYFIRNIAKVFGILKFIKFYLIKILTNL